MPEPRPRPVRDFLAAAGLTLLSRLPFLGPGYGLDADAWRVAWSARTLATTGHYEASRFPGYPLQEFACALLWPGGAYALTGMTALMSALAAGCFALCLRRLGSRDAVVAALAMASAPALFLVSVQALDFAWGLALALAALWLALGGRAARAGLVAGLAIGTRATWILWLVPLAAALATSVPRGARGRALATLAAGALAVGALAFVPSFLTYGPGFLRFYESGYPAALLVIKNATVDLWGVPGALAVALALPLALAGPRGGARGAALPGAHGGLLAGAGTAILLFLAVYLRLPSEASYLIPVVPLALLLLGARLPRPAFVAVCVALLLSPWLVKVSLPGDGAPPGPGAVAFRLLGRPLVLDPLRGPVIVARERTVRSVRYVDRVLARAARLPGGAVVVAGDWLPQIRVRLGGKEQGGVRYVHLLGDEELRSLRGCGAPVYFLTGADWTSARSAGGADLTAGGARLLDVPE